MTTLRQALLPLSVAILSAPALANDLPTGPVAPVAAQPYALVMQMSDAIQSKSWVQSVQLASRVAQDANATPNSKLAAATTLCISRTVAESFALALEACDRAVTLAPTKAAAYINRGNLYSTMGKPALAKADYEKARALEPTNTAVNENISAMRWRDGHSYVAMVAKR